MSKKLNNPNILGKIGDEEEIFILRAQDVLAPMVVEYWAELAAKMQVNTPKVLDAFRCAEAMRADRRPKKIPD
jgi:hypothetical protein